MRFQMIFCTIGIISGILILFLNPNLLNYSLDFAVKSQEALGSSGVKGSPFALAVTVIPIFFGLFGFAIGYIIDKGKRKN